MTVKVEFCGDMLVDEAGKSGAKILQYLGGSLFLPTECLTPAVVVGPCKRLLVEVKPARGNYGFTCNVVRVLEFASK